MDKIKWLQAGHAGGVLEDGGRQLGFDLVYEKRMFYGGAWKLDPHPIKVNAYPIATSHEHEDHWDDFYGPVSYYFSLFSPHQHHEKLRIFYSIQTAGDQSALIKCDDGFTFYHGNDNVPDPNKIKIAMESLQVKAVDLALIPFEYNGWYPHCADYDLSKKKSELHRLEQKQIDTGIGIAKALKAKLCLITGADLVYTGPADLIARQISRKEIIDQAARKGVNLTYLAPGDAVTKELKVIPNEHNYDQEILKRLETARKNAHATCQIAVSGKLPKAWGYKTGALGAYPSYRIEIDNEFCDAFLKGMPFEQVAHARGFRLNLVGDHTPAVWQSILRYL